MIRFRLQELMEQRGLTYRDVSTGAQVSTNTLYRIIKNEARMIGIGVLERLLMYLECEPGDLIELVRIDDNAQE